MKQTCRRLANLVATASVLFTASGAMAQTAPLNMKTAIEISLANNYSLKADSMNKVTAGYQVNVLKADFLPQVNYANKWEYNLALPTQMLPGNMLGQPGKEFVPVQFGTRYGVSSGVDITQSLINKSSRLKISQAGLNYNISATKHKITREELAYQVATSFYDLQTNAELIRTTNHDYQNIMDVVKIARAQFENGILKRIDYEALQINAANKDSYLRQLQTQYTDQITQFNYLLGIPADSKTVIDDSIYRIARPADQGNQDLQREDIRLAQQLIGAKEIEIKSIRAEKLPVVSSYFKFNYSAQFNKPGNVTNNDYWFKSSSVGVTASIPIFDGYRRNNRVNIAQSQLQQLQFQELLQKQLANKEWTSANEILQNDLQQYKITQQNLHLAERVFASRRSLYTEGVSSLIELLDAEKELTQARNNHIKALINVQTGIVNVYKAKGTLLTEFVNTL